MNYCCEVFPKIAKRLKWVYFGLSDICDQYEKPYIVYPDHIVDVNFCPSCGADIRGIVITKDEFDKLK